MGTTAALRNGSEIGWSDFDYLAASRARIVSKGFRYRS